MTRKVALQVPGDAQDVTVLIGNTEIVASRKFANDPPTLAENGRIVGRTYHFADGGHVVVYWTESL